MSIAAGCGSVVSAAIVSLSGELGFWGINLLGAAWGFFAFPLYSLAVAHANDYAEPSDYVMVSSGLLFVFGSGAILGPFAASTIMAMTSSAGLYILSGVAHLSVALYVLFRIFRRTSAPTDQHITFSDALATAHTASQVYEEEIHYQADDET